MTAVTLTVNGRKVTAEVAARTHLADFLRDHLRLTGTHLGCEHGVCGACTVLIDDKPARSCITYAAACDGLAIRTIEGFEDDALMGELRQAFSREHGLQCGFCTAGMLISSRDIVQRIPGVDERRIRMELSGNLCRCTGYLGIVKAVSSVVEMHRGDAVAKPAPRSAEAPARFAPAATAAGAAPAAAALPDEAARQGWTRLEESFVIAAAPAVVWRALADFPKVAACLPGAELTEHDDRSVRGRLKVKLGPMAASFAGSASVERDDSALAAVVKGAGSDGNSRSRTRGQLTYCLTPEGVTSTRVSVSVEYDLQGPLAQFSRSSLARDFAGRIVAEFAGNLNATLGGGADAVPRPASLNLGLLIWGLIRSRLARLFGR